MQCRNCSGNDFRETSTGNYKCQYCGTLYYEEKRKSPRTVTVAPQRINRRFIIISSVVLAAAVAVILPLTLVDKNKRENERDDFVSKNTWQKDIERNSIPREDFEVKRDNESAGRYESVREDYKESLPSPQGKIVSTGPIRDSIGNIYFLCIVENNGSVSLRQPLVTVRLFSKSGEKLDTGKGYAFKNVLNPGERTPVYILIKDYPKYESYKAEYSPEKPYVIPPGGIVDKKFSAGISDVKMNKGDFGSSYKVSGRIKNTSGKAGSYVKVGVVLYDKINSVIGYGTAYTGERILKPGDADNFKIYITTVNGIPDHYDLYYDAMEN